MRAEASGSQPHQSRTMDSMGGEGTERRKNFTEVGTDPRQVNKETGETEGAVRAASELPNCRGQTEEMPSVREDIPLTLEKSK